MNDNSKKSRNIYKLICVKEYLDKSEVIELYSGNAETIDEYFVKRNINDVQDLYEENIDKLGEHTGDYTFKIEYVNNGLHKQRMILFKNDIKELISSYVCDNIKKEYFDNANFRSMFLYYIVPKSFNTSSKYLKYANDLRNNKRSIEAFENFFYSTIKRDISKSHKEKILNTPGLTPSEIEDLNNQKKTLNYSNLRKIYSLCRYPKEFVMFNNGEYPSVTYNKECIDEFEELIRNDFIGDDGLRYPETSEENIYHCHEIEKDDDTLKTCPKVKRKQRKSRQNKGPWQQEKFPGVHL